MTTVRQLYRYTALFGVLGFVSYYRLQGFRTGLGFLLGAAISFGNLWLFNWLAGAIASSGDARKHWQAGMFIGRYLILFTGGYVIVKGLGVNPLAVVLGLFASTAAVLLSIAIEFLQSLFGRRRSH